MLQAVAIISGVRKRQRAAAVHVLADVRALAPSPCRTGSPTYNTSMLDIKLIRERPDVVRQLLETGGVGTTGPLISCWISMTKGGKPRGGGGA